MVRRRNTLRVLRAERHPLVFLASFAILARIILFALSLTGTSVDPMAASLMHLCAPYGGSQIAKIEGSTHTQNPLGIGCDCTYMCPHTFKQVTYLSIEPENWQSPALKLAGSISLERVLENVKTVRGHHFLIRAPPTA